MFIPFEIFQIMIYKEWNNLPYFKVQTQIDYFENNKQKIFDNLPCHLESIISKNTVLFVNCERNITNIHHDWRACEPEVIYICNIPQAIYK